MNLHQISTHYTLLSAEERFRLILAASGRDDTIEREKLVAAGPVRNLALADHWPYAQAFSEISMFSFMELLEEAAIYHDLLRLRGSKSHEHSSEELAKDATEITAAWQKEVDLVLATGCQLMMKLKGWELFCKKLQVPDRLLWRDLPGYRRLEANLEIARQWAFRPVGFLRWLNRIRPEGAPKLQQLPISARLIARTNEQAYRERARWWGAKA
jgi:hypothetical protein